MKPNKSFNPNDVGLVNNGIFGLPHNPDTADMVLLTVPWDVTVSYREGTSHAPQHIIDASSKCDLYHPDFYGIIGDGIATTAIESEVLSNHDTYRQQARSIIHALEQGETLDEHPHLLADQRTINDACHQLKQDIYRHVETCIKENQLVGLIGGDHSTSLGCIEALIDYIPSFGVLQIDAHMDCRPAYEGFTYSHASVMHHVLSMPDIKRLVQVGIRDYSEEERTFTKQQKGRVKTFYDREIMTDLYQGKTWDSICRRIINNCPDNVYISLDIDGLSPQYCPHTGTPVAGGLDYNQIIYLLAKLVKSGRRIIGFDLVEVNGSADSTDIIVASQLLYQLCGYYWLSNQDDT